VTIFPGDFVVHRDLGIAQFVEEANNADEAPGARALVLQFHNGAEYEVPPAERAKISRLKAADASHPPKLTQLTPLGQRRWVSRLEKVREQTKEAAEHILRLYAERDDVSREPCRPDGAEFAKFEAAFAYPPTADQQKCFDDVERDMVYRRAPMDRLVCGESLAFAAHLVCWLLMFKRVTHLYHMKEHGDV
jgi:transcription-repair coupling factor (superfamily II helicase)